MAPATTLGAATPVSIGLTGPGGDRKPVDGDKGASAPPSGKPAAPPADATTAKQVHDAAAFIRGLAQQRGRNVEWAERAVREAVSLTAGEALREHVVDLIAHDVPDLLERIDGRVVRMPAGEVTLQTRGVAHEVLGADWRQRLLAVVANPSVALILMLIGLYGLMFEFASPGFGVPGVVGALCLLLGLFALQLLPVNYAGLALILLGVGLMAAEAVTPTFGVLGVGGIAAFIAGGILLFDTDLPQFDVALPLLVGLAASSAALIALGGGMAMRARRRPVLGGPDELIGLPGEVVKLDADQAWAEVRGELWKVRAEQPLAPRQRVRVIAVHGLELDVVPADETFTTKGSPS
jgi:membrane-bound serine protease (ClpP class)